MGNGRIAPAVFFPIVFFPMAAGEYRPRQKLLKSPGPPEGLVPPSSKEAERAYLHRIVAGAALFRPVSEADLGELVRCARSLALPRGKTLSPPKGKDAEIYIVESGAIAALDRDPSADKTILVALYGPGDVVGLGGAGLHATHNHQELKALSNIALAAIPIPDFLRVLRRSTELSEAALAALGIELRAMAARFAASLQNPLELRLAGFLAQLAAIATGNSWEPSANIGRLQQTLVADMLGVSREHVNRTMTMWEKSGLIFQTKGGDVVIENRKRLTLLAGARRAQLASPVENEWLWEIDAHLNYGLNEIAYDLAIEGVKRSPRDDRFKYFAVLAMARMGALKEALSLADSFRLSADDPHEDIASIRPRLRRDLAFSRRDGPDKALLKRAAEDYEKVFRSVRKTYPGVNAAATFAMAGDLKSAKALAREVSDIAAASLAEIDDDEPSYWSRSTLAECRLLEGDTAGAALLFASAVRAVDAAPGKKAATRRQLQRLAATMPIDRPWIDRAVPQGGVLFYGGPLVVPEADATRPLERMQRSLEAFLDRHEIAVAVGALAAGADILIAETLLDAGVGLHVVLPLAPVDFLDGSVTPSGDDWRERYIACVERAQTIEWARRTTASRGAYRLGSRMAIGKTIRQAEELVTGAFGFLALQRGRTPANSISHENREILLALGVTVEAAEDDWPAPASSGGGAGDYLAALIVQESKTGVDASKAHFVTRQGDLSISAFTSPADAIGAARNLMRDGGAKTRLWLDVGVADSASEKGRKAFPASLVTSACRPQTAPGKAYASEGFVNAATATPGCDLEFEYVGITATEEKLDPCPLYLADI